jgi:hypothetical protein
MGILCITAFSMMISFCGMWLYYGIKLNSPADVFISSGLGIGTLLLISAELKEYRSNWND